MNELQYRRFTIRCKLLVALKVRLCQKTSKRPCRVLGGGFVGQMKLRLTCTKLMGREIYGEGERELMIWTASSVKNCGGRAIASTAVSETGSADSSSKFWIVSCCTQIHSSPAKLIRWHFTVQMDDDLKHKVKARVSPSKETEYSSTQQSVVFSY